MDIGSDAIRVCNSAFSRAVIFQNILHLGQIFRLRYRPGFIQLQRFLDALGKIFIVCWVLLILRIDTLGEPCANRISFGTQ